MVVSGTLYTYPESFRGYKAQVAAQYSGAKVTVAKNFELGVTNATPEFLKKFPFGKVPAFESSNGDCVFESNAIAWYVANEQLRGKTDAEQTRVLQWVNFSDNEILPAVCTWVFPCLGATQFNKGSTETAKTQLKAALTKLNTHLETRTFLATERVTLADITLACDLLLAYRMVFEPTFRSAFGNVTRWFTTITGQKEFSGVAGATQLCEKAAQFDSKKYAELHAKTGGEKKKAGGGDAQKPKEVKKEKPVKKEVDEEEDEPKPVKPKDPFLQFPVGSFVMDEWKRFYSNNPANDAEAWFWEKLDKEHYSLWFGEYEKKWAKDLGMLYMTSNLVKGMFQRLDGVRKHAFGSLVTFGEDKNNTIAGIFLFRGQGCGFDLDEDFSVDSESYTWKKLEYSDEETKKLVHNYFFAADNETFDFEGKKLVDLKVFK